MDEETLYNTKVYLRESPYDNPMELDVEEIEHRDGLFIFHCEEEKITVPVANIMLIEQSIGDYY